MDIIIVCSRFYNVSYGSSSNGWRMTVFECSSYMEKIRSKVPNSRVTSVIDSESHPIDESVRLRVESWHLHYTEMDFIPEGIKEVFPSLKVLMIFNHALLAIRSENLRQFGDSLKYLLLANTEITSLDRNLFEFNQNLEQIQLHSNKKLRYIDPELFKSFTSLKNLRDVNFQNSACINQTFDAGQHQIGSFVWNSDACLDGNALMNTRLVEMSGRSLQSLNNESCSKKQLKDATDRIKVNNNENSAMILSRIEKLEINGRNLLSQVSHKTRKTNCRIDKIEEKLDSLIEVVNSIKNILQQ